jgi:hypothetical protein
MFFPDAVLVSLSAVTFGSVVALVIDIFWWLRR